MMLSCITRDKLSAENEPERKARTLDDNDASVFHSYSNSKAVKDIFILNSDILVKSKSSCI